MRWQRRVEASADLCQAHCLRNLSSLPRSLPTYHHTSRKTAYHGTSQHSALVNHTDFRAHVGDRDHGCTAVPTMSTYYQSIIADRVRSGGSALAQVQHMLPVASTSGKLEMCSSYTVVPCAIPEQLFPFPLREISAFC
jgi:hypothetical protein